MCSQKKKEFFGFKEGLEVENYSPLRNKNSRKEGITHQEHFVERGIFYFGSC